MCVVRGVNGCFRVVGDTPPNRLGKFLDAMGTRASLEGETIKFTPPNKLNDRWDCIPFRYREKDVEEFWQRSILSQLFPELKQYVIDKYVNRDWSSLQEMLSNTIGVASFADLRYCDLSWMWDHYGDYHKGGIIVFETSGMGTFLKVRCSEKRPEISIPINEDTYPPDEVLAVLTTKARGTANHWEKECEWRMIDHLSSLNKTETANGPIYLKSYHKAFIKVICGCRMDISTFSEITEIANSKGVLVEREKD